MDEPKVNGISRTIPQWPIQLDEIDFQIELNEDYDGPIDSAALFRCDDDKSLDDSSSKDVSLLEDDFVIGIDSVYASLQPLTPTNDFFSDDGLVPLPSEPTIGLDFQCAHCNEKFSQLTGLSAHLRTHERRKCTECKRQYVTDRELLRHMKVHEAPVVFKCPKCPKAYTSKVVYVYHVATHKEKSFECEMCHKRFVDRKSLKAHRRFHELNRVNPYECPLCGDRFSSPPVLEDHIQTHVQEKILVYIP